MSAEEMAAFRTRSFHARAVTLRRWDDPAKVPNLATPPLVHFARDLDSGGESSV